LSFNSVALVSTARDLIGSSHTLGDFEHEPAESGETDPQRSITETIAFLFFLQDDYEFTVR
jgi:hypothetical protein